MLERFERLRELAAAEGAISSAEHWPCDFGAAAALLLAERAGLPAGIGFGFYWHPNLRAYCQAIGETYDPGLWRVPPEAPCEEHHYWLQLDDPKAGTVLVDANAELRGEPRVQRLADAQKELAGSRLPRYQDAWESSRWSMIADDDDLDLLEGPFERLIEEDWQGYGERLVALKRAVERLDQV